MEVFNMCEYEIIYYCNNEFVSIENTIACNRFTAEFYAHKTCYKMYKITDDDWSFSCRKIMA